MLSSLDAVDQSEEVAPRRCPLGGEKTDVSFKEIDDPPRLPYDLLLTLQRQVFTNSENFIMLRLLPLLAVFLLLPFAFARTAQGENEDDKLLKIFKSWLDADFKLRPIEATRLGEHGFDDKLADYSLASRKAHEKLLLTTQERLTKSLNAEKLSASGKLDLDIFQDHLQRELWFHRNTNSLTEDPRTYNDGITESVYLLLSQSTLPRERNVRNALSRITQIPKVVESAMKNLESPPKIWVETAIKQNKGAIAFYAGGIYELAQENPEKSELKPACDKLVKILEGYQKFLEEKLLPRAKGDWRIGKEKFFAKLVTELQADIPAREVLSLAKAEAKRVENDMYIIARQLWHKAYPKETLPLEDEMGRRETIKRVLAQTNKDHGKVEELLDEAKSLSTKIKKFITEKDILRLPDPDRCKIVEMPEFQRGFSVAYLNPAPPLDPKAASFYAISPPPSGWDARRVESFLQEYNRSMMAILTIHEAYPGHYVQLEYSNRHPSLVRRILQSGTFAEGWAVYTEQMMLDQGYGEGDLVLRLNQLKFYLRAVINAILDHEMHCNDMSDEQAMKLLVENGFQSEGEALGKVTRAKLSSCQLSTYFVGRMAFWNLRQKVQREMGDTFELGRYHEAVLSQGTIPVKHLPQLVRERLKKER
jgi:uncharacterized protein (DUF885 family)